MALFDVGSASVGVGIAVHTHEGVRLLWDMRLSYAYQRDLDYLRFERSMLATLLEAGMRLTTEGVQAAQQKHSFPISSLRPVCILSEPWFIGGVRESTVTKEQGVTVTPAVLEDLERRARQEFETSKQMSTWHDVMGTDTTLLDTRALQVSLDGYPVTKYLGRKACQLRMVVYAAHAPKTVLAEVEDVLLKTLPSQRVEFRTSTEVAYGALEVQGLTHGNLLLVELGGEITSVALIRKSALRAVRVFPLGTNHVLREGFPQVASYAEARGKLELLKPEPAKQGDTPPLPKGVVHSLKEWHESLIKAVTELSEGITPPRNAVLIANELWKPWFIPALRSPWKQPGVRTELGFSVVEQQGVLGTGSAAARAADGRIASMLRGILTR